MATVYTEVNNDNMTEQTGTHLCDICDKIIKSGKKKKVVSYHFDVHRPFLYTGSIRVQNQNVERKRSETSFGCRCGYSNNRSGNRCQTKQVECLSIPIQFHDA